MKLKGTGHSLLWLKYAELEKSYGHTERSLATLKRGVGLVKDWPEEYGVTWINELEDSGTPLSEILSCREQLVKVVRRHQQLQMKVGKSRCKESLIKRIPFSLPLPLLSPCHQRSAQEMELLAEKSAIEEAKREKRLDKDRQFRVGPGKEQVGKMGLLIPDSFPIFQGEKES